MRKRIRFFAALALGCLAAFVLATLVSLKPAGSAFDTARADAQSVSVTDRTGQPLTVTYTGRWNVTDNVPLYAMPDLLVSAFIASEDRRFYDHGGVDWAGRSAALWQNLRHRKTVRGASTITEQVVRLLHPRPRTLWSKWVEGIEATRLETHADKNSILEFYLNQIPYTSGRRGAAQAAHYYFNRDLSTLNNREMLALAILARAPSAYDLYTAPGRLDAPLARLAARMKDTGLLNAASFHDISVESFDLHKPSLPVDARHFARYVRLNNAGHAMRTTLDASLQAQVQNILDQRLKKLKPKNVANAAALVVDHTTGEILAWVVAGADDAATKGGEIDAVTAPRQPGSTLKPFVYAAALEKGWTAATIINDAPVAEAVGSGLHRFRNYSNTHYGPITVREALGNSLNIPAVLAVGHVGVAPFLSVLHRLGFNSLDRGANVYDEGLALGNGEVTLLEMVGAYSALANRGAYRPLKFLLDAAPGRGEAVFTPETASIIGNVLSDPRARALEFGNDSILNLPVRTAVKTGTSTDYRDAWTLGYNDRYTVGLWMGNLDRTPMKDVTGSTGPALALRSIFQRLNQSRETKPLYLSPALLQKDICTRPDLDAQTCPRRTEYFAGAAPETLTAPASDPSIELARPTEGLMMAYDPRIPPGHQKFRFELTALKPDEQAEWILNGKSLGRSAAPRYLWPVEKGPHQLAVAIYADGKLTRTLSPVAFTVR